MEEKYLKHPNTMEQSQAIAPRTYRGHPDRQRDPNDTNAYAKNGPRSGAQQSRQAPRSNPNPASSSHSDSDLSIFAAGITLR